MKKIRKKVPSEFHLETNLSEILEIQEFELIFPIVKIQPILKILKGPSTISSQCPIDLISFLLVQLNQMEPENDGDNSWFCLRAYKGGASTVEPFVQVKCVNLSMNHILLYNITHNRLNLTFCRQTTYILLLLIKMSFKKSISTPNNCQNSSKIKMKHYYRNKKMVISQPTRLK